MFNPALPFWYQIAQVLRSQILSSGEKAPFRLPTEGQLAQQHGVSLITIRQALKSLESESMISRHRRRGTYAHPPSKSTPAGRMIGLADPVMIQRTADEIEVLSRRLVRTPATVASEFGAEPELFEFHRLYKDRGAITAYGVNYVVPEHGQRITAKAAREPITRVLKDRLGVPIRRMRQSIEAQLPPSEVAQRLEIDVMTPVLLFTGKTYGESQKLIDMVRMYCRADRMRFSLDFEMKD